MQGAKLVGTGSNNPMRFGNIDGNKKVQWDSASCKKGHYNKLCFSFGS